MDVVAVAVLRVTRRRRGRGGDNGTGGTLLVKPTGNAPENLRTRQQCSVSQVGA